MAGILTPAQASTLQRTLATVNNVEPMLMMLEALGASSSAIATRAAELRQLQTYLNQLATTALAIDRQVASGIGAGPTSPPPAPVYSPPPPAGYSPMPTPLPMVPGGVSGGSGMCGVYWQGGDGQIVWRTEPGYGQQHTQQVWDNPPQYAIDQGLAVFDGAMNRYYRKGNCQ